MSPLKKLKQEINSFSTWFKAVFIIMLIVYFFLWLFTIYLSQVQISRGIEPTLPGAPKDSQEYILLSESIARGEGLATNGRLETLRGFGYPLFVAVIKTTGGSYFAVTFIQILLVFASAFVLRRIGTVFSEKKVGEIATTLFLINPVTMILSLLILTDVLFLFLLTLGFYLAITINQKKPFLRMCGVSALFVCAIYVRGMGIFSIPIFMAPVLATKLSFKLKTKLIGVMLLFIAICVAPWVVRNYIQTGVVAFNSFESVGLSFAVPNFLSTINGTKEADEVVAFHKATGVPEENWREYDGRDIRYSSQINRVGERIIMERPFSYLKYHTITSISFLFPSSILFMRDAYDEALKQQRPFRQGSIYALTSGDFRSFFNGIKEVWWKFAERILWLLGLFIALYVAWRDRRNPLVWVFIFIPGYLMLLSGPTAGPRLSFQAWPYMFLLFAVGGVYLFQIFTSWKNKKKNEHTAFI